jgi:hypothetical protein
MNFLKNLARSFSGGGSNTGGDAGMYYYVKCLRCGEVIQIRVNKNNDLTVQYGEKDAKSDTFFVHKVIVGQKCYNRMEADFTYSHSRALVEKKVAGGEFVTQELYESYRQTVAPKV